MKTSVLTSLVILLFTYSTFGQDYIDVTEKTIKIGAGKEEELYFGFASGDKIVFNFQEVDKKELKEIEIIEYPNSSKFSDYKTNRIENKILNVSNAGIYVFRLKNSSLIGRVCKIKIQRIAASEATMNFNPTVSWVMKEDTTWNSFTKDVVVGYDTVYVQKSKKVLINSEQKEELILDKSQRVHSTSNENGNKTAIHFTLPPNQITGNQSKKVISWGYWVGVNQEGEEAWKSNVKAVGSLAKGAASYFMSPLGALAVGKIAELAIPKVGENVKYAITDQQNRNLFLNNYQYRGYDFGNGVAGYRLFNSPNMLQGTWFICMSNDNIMQGIDVNVKVAAIVEYSTYEDQQYTDMIVTPQSEKQIFKEPKIYQKKIPVIGI